MKKEISAIIKKHLPKEVGEVLKLELDDLKELRAGVGKHKQLLSNRDDSIERLNKEISQKDEQISSMKAHH